MYYCDVDEHQMGPLNIKPTQDERARLRTLAARYREIAEDEVMEERKSGWRNLNDLNSDHPMILCEANEPIGFVSDEEIKCTNPYLRNVETFFLRGIKMYEVVQDDSVLEPYFLLPWCIVMPSYGSNVIIEMDTLQESIAALPNFPLETPDDLKKLEKRGFLADRERSLDFKNTLDDIFGDVLPVILRGIDFLSPFIGLPFAAGLYWPSLTYDAFALVGNENLMLWGYDEPEALKWLMDFLTDDRKRFLQFLADEKLIMPNTRNQVVAPVHYGYVSDLPNTLEPVSSVMECWGWVESQETAIVSPDMFEEFFLPAFAEWGNSFGLMSYGCCEAYHNKIDLIKKTFPRLRNLTIAPWTDRQTIADAMGADYTYTVKVHPSHISGAKPNWDAASQDVQDAWNRFKEFPVSFGTKEFYDINKDPERLAQWVRMVKEIIGR